MESVLLFIGAIAALFAIAPLATWAAAGRRQAWEAVKGQAVVWSIFAVCAVVGAVFAGLGLIAP